MGYSAGHVTVEPSDVSRLRRRWKALLNSKWMELLPGAENEQRKIMECRKATRFVVVDLELVNPS